MTKIAQLISWLIEIFFTKPKRAYVLKTSQIFAEGLSIFAFIILVLISFVLFTVALYHLVISMDAHGFVKDLLSSFELLFIAPIPLLVVFSFKRYIIKMFPLEIRLSELEKSHLMDEVVAKKIFVSSIIGVVSTFLLSLFIETLSAGPDVATRKFLSMTGPELITILVVILLMFFLLILIYYYKILSHHFPEK